MYRNSCLPRWAVLAAGILWAVEARAIGPQPTLLWPDGAPGAVGDESHDRPDLRAYLLPQDRANGAAVIICPGGGYQVLAMDHEGHQVARWFNRFGVTAFVLKYRLGPRYRHPTPLQDAQRAIRWVRSRAEQYHVAPDRIGIMGFSAGGHLASTAATHFDSGDPQATDPIERVSSRPDFAILAYPVISMKPSVTHSGSRNNLLGADVDPDLVEQVSNEEQVTAQTPPTFLFHTAEDPAVLVENSLEFFRACREAGVPAELHVFQSGPHGVGLAEGDPVSGQWPRLLKAWMQGQGWLAGVDRAAVAGTVRVDGEPLRWGMITFVPSAEQEPVAFGLVSRGKFEIPAERGPVTGSCKIEVRDLGSVEAIPTIDDAQRIDNGTFSCQIKPGMNRIVVEIE